MVQKECFLDRHICKPHLAVSSAVRGLSAACFKQNSTGFKLHFSPGVTACLFIYEQTNEKDLSQGSDCSACTVSDR